MPSLFACNAALVVSGRRRGPHRHPDRRPGVVQALAHDLGRGPLADPRLPQLQVMLEGECATRRRFLALVRDFIVFEDDGGGAPAKKMAGYHQFHAVETAVGETLRAAELQRTAEERGRYESGRKPGGAPGDRRIGVVWHTQGSGKSLTMAFYAGRIIRDPAMGNPTVVVLTDRNDLDDQLFGTFARCRDLLRQPPVQAASRADLRGRLAVEAGGVVFTTIQKVLPRGEGRPAPGALAAAQRRGHRRRGTPQPVRLHRRLRAPHARPRSPTPPSSASPARRSSSRTPAPAPCSATTSASTTSGARSRTRRRCPSTTRAGSPGWRSTRASGRTSTPRFEEATEGEENRPQGKAQDPMGAARSDRRRGEASGARRPGRRLAFRAAPRSDGGQGDGRVHEPAHLHRPLARARAPAPGVARRGRRQGTDQGRHDRRRLRPARLQQPHIRSKPRREALAKRFRDPGDPLRVVLVRDMWLTGFDAPSLHTMYVDKPMRGHGLMQAIARVNRVFRDKPGGLVVDYLGLAHELKRALATYTESGGAGRAALDQAEAVRGDAGEVRESAAACSTASTGRRGPPARRRSVWACCRRAQEHVLAQEDRQGALRACGARPLPGLRARGTARGRAPPSATTWRSFQAVRSVLAKRSAAEARPEEALDHAVRRIISRAVAPDGERDRHLRRRRPGEARPLGPVRRVPGRGAGHAAAQPRRRAVAETARGRACRAPAQERRAGAFLRRDAGADPAPLSEPRRRGRGR